MEGYVGIEQSETTVLMTYGMYYVIMTYGHVLCHNDLWACIMSYGMHYVIMTYGMHNDL